MCGSIFSQRPQGLCKSLEFPLFLSLSSPLSISLSLSISLFLPLSSSLPPSLPFLPLLFSLSPSLALPLSLSAYLCLCLSPPLSFSLLPTLQISALKILVASSLLSSDLCLLTLVRPRPQSGDSRSAGRSPGSPGWLHVFHRSPMAHRPAFENLLHKLCDCIPVAGCVQ